MISGVLIVLKIILAISIIGKSYLHAHIAYRNNIILGGAGGLPVRTLWYLKQPVTEEYEALKKRCNQLQTLNMILLAIVVLMSYLVLNDLLMIILPALVLARFK